MYRTYGVVALSALLGLGTASASAQTRAAELAREQQEKSTRLAPNTAGTTERALDWLETYLADPNTVYVTFGGLYPSGGLAPGAAVRRTLGPARLNAGGALSLRGYKLAHAALDLPHLAGGALEITTRLRWVDATQVPFHGTGSDTTTESVTAYGLRTLELRGGLTAKPAAWFRAGGSLAARRFETRSGAGSRPSIETRFDPFTAPGIFTDVRLTQATAHAAVDWRESAGYTRRGGLYSIAVHDFRDRDERFGFRRLDAEIQQMVPLLKEHWVLAFRGLLQTTSTEEGQRVPYYLLPSLGGAHSLRGYSDFRFQDRHLLLVSGEYRWIPSRVLDMALFIDAGKVAPTRGALDFDGLRAGYGIGLRVHGPTFTPLRLDLARGDDGWRLHVTGGVGF